jgi:hypothetical protein
VVSSVLCASYIKPGFDTWIFPGLRVLRVDLDCIVPYLTLAKSGISQIHYVKSRIWLGRPSVQYDIYSSSLSKSYCSFGKMENSGTNVDFAFFCLKKKSYGRSYGEFSEPGFPHNFAKNYR